MRTGPGRGGPCRAGPGRALEGSPESAMQESDRSCELEAVMLRTVAAVADRCPRERHKQHCVDHCPCYNRHPSKRAEGLRRTGGDVSLARAQKNPSKEPVALGSVVAFPCEGVDWRASAQNDTLILEKFSKVQSVCCDDR